MWNAPHPSDLDDPNIVSSSECLRLVGPIRGAPPCLKAAWAPLDSLLFLATHGGDIVVYKLEAEAGIDDKVLLTSCQHIYSFGQALGDGCCFLGIRRHPFTPTSRDLLVVAFDDAGETMHSWSVQRPDTSVDTDVTEDDLKLSVTALEGAAMPGAVCCASVRPPIGFAAQAWPI